MSPASTDQLFLQALAHHQAGRLHDALNAYRQILSQNPRHADALHLSGVIALQRGDFSEAQELIEQALAIEPRWPEALNNLGQLFLSTGRPGDALVALQRAGEIAPNSPALLGNLASTLKALHRPADAVAACQRALQIDPASPDIYCNLAAALNDLGQSRKALDAAQRALQLRGDFPEALLNLGVAYDALTFWNDAIDAYQKALAHRPAFVECLHNLAGSLHRARRLQDSLTAYRRAAELRPDSPTILSNMAVALSEDGQSDEALAAARRAADLAPRDHAVLRNLGMILRNADQFDAAEKAFRDSLTLAPHDPITHNTLAGLLYRMNQPDAAVPHVERALQLSPDYPEAWLYLALVRSRQGQLSASEEAARRALALRPDFPQAQLALINALWDQDRQEEALDLLRRGLELHPQNAELHYQHAHFFTQLGQARDAIAAFRRAHELRPRSPLELENLGYLLHMPSDVSPDEIFAMHLRWEAQAAAPLRHIIAEHTNDRSAERRLRIGYVSADFRAHACATYIAPFLSHRDPAFAEIYAYAHLARPDATTERFRGYVDHWRDITRLSDSAVENLIRHDRIDILVDLMGHTAHHRLLVFACKPAPVQVTCVGYPNTTGLRTIDYRLTDARCDPPGQTEQWHTEELIRLPEVFLCYEPPADAPAAAASPATAAGMITFGVFNNALKISDRCLDLWAQILTAVPASKLLLKGLAYSYPGTCHAMAAQFAARGIAADRVEFRGAAASLREHLAHYGQVDISLDTFPYHGTMTTSESLYMGVPVVTLQGSTHVSRVGVSLLSAVGLPELIADSGDDYVRIAAALAGDMPRLAALRADLRWRMEQSPHMDTARYMQNVQAEYRRMWRRWCRSEVS